MSFTTSSVNFGFKEVDVWRLEEVFGNFSPNLNFLVVPLEIVLSGILDTVVVVLGLVDWLLLVLGLEVEEVVFVF